MPRKKIVFAALAAACLWPSRADAARARLVFTAGPVSLEAGGKARRVKAEDAVAQGEAVVTGKGATAIVALPDGSRLKLRESSRIVLQLPGENSALTEVLLGQGGLFAKVAKQEPGREFRVRARSAVAAVRGTEFFTAFGRSRDLWICVNEGVVEVGADAAKKTALLHPGEGVLIKAGKDLTKPQAYDWTKKLNWNMDAAAGAVEDRTDLGAAYSDLLEQDYR